MSRQYNPAPEQQPDSDFPWTPVLVVAGAGLGIFLLTELVFARSTPVPSPAPAPRPTGTTPTPAPRPTTPASPSPVAVPVPPPTIAATPPPASTTDPRCAGIPGATGRWSTNLNRCACPTNQTMQNSGRADQYCGCTPPQRLVGDTCQSQRCTINQVEDASGRCIDLPFDYAGLYYVPESAERFVIPSSSCADDCIISVGDGYVYKRVSGGYEIYLTYRTGLVRKGVVARLGSLPAGATPGITLVNASGALEGRMVKLPMTISASTSMTNWRSPSVTIPANTNFLLVKFVGEASSLAEVAALTDFRGYVRLLPYALLMMSSGPASSSGLDAVDLATGDF